MRTKPMIENVPDPRVFIKRWTIPMRDFIATLRSAELESDQAMIDHLLNDFWFCDEYMLLKSDIVGEVQ